MTVKEFISLTKNDAELMKAFNAEKPEGVDALIEFARKHGYDIDRTAVDDAALSDAVGGAIPNIPPSVKNGLCWHKGCDGLILYVGNPFHDCECEKCHETHYWLWKFDYYTT